MSAKLAIDGHLITEAQKLETIELARKQKLT